MWTKYFILRNDIFKYDSKKIIKSHIDDIKKSYNDKQDSFSLNVSSFSEKQIEITCKNIKENLPDNAIEKCYKQGNLLILKFNRN